MRDWIKKLSCRSVFVSARGFAVAVVYLILSLSTSGAWAACATLADALNTTGLVWLTDGNATWFAQAITNHDGECAAQSGDIPDWWLTTLQTTVTNRGQIAFKWSVSSEPEYDKLYFLINSAVVTQISGFVSWQEKSYYLADNVTTLRWEYVKDGTVSSGSDAGWVDEVAWTPFTRLLSADDQLMFGTVLASTTNTIDWVISNSGTETITLNGVTTNGTGADAFRFAGLPATLGPGAAATCSVSFVPLAVQSYTANVQVAHNAHNTPTPFTLQLSGSGYIPIPRYVVTNNPYSTEPYTNWFTAATNIQNAVDVASDGDTIWVSNGVYASGERVIYGAMPNRVAITKRITVQSVNGPSVTSIRGSKDPLTTNGNEAVRCVYVGTNAVLSGFTLADGATRAEGDSSWEQGGGGAWCETTGVLTNCMLSGNSAGNGGGSYRGTLNNCMLSSNSASIEGGGSYYSVLNNCTLSSNSARYGGGSYGGTMNSCLLSGNTASVSGGGSRMGTLNNCTLTSNSAAQYGYGGGTDFCTVNNSTLSGNSADNGGGSHYGTLSNCTYFGNRATYGGASYYGTLYNCTITSNNATYGGGSHETALYNCMLSGNMASYSGGGSSYGTLTNCTLTNNVTHQYGGGSCYGTLNNCSLAGNLASINGGGSYCGTLNNCTIACNLASYSGGGSYNSTLTNCTLSRNLTTYSDGGGASLSKLNNCMISGNSAGRSGGGSYLSTLNNCTLSGNSASNGGGGSYYDTLDNCIVYYNTAASSPNHMDSTFRYSCTAPEPGGTGCITNAPNFVNAAASDFHLSAGSPCIDKGNNTYVQGTKDLDRNPRIMNGIVDMGAYEYQFNLGYWAWAAAISNGLSGIDQCATGDGYPNLLKYVTGSSPVNPDNLAQLDCTKSNGLLVLIFNRNTNAGDATLIVQGAFAISNGSAWSGLATNANGSWGGANNVVEVGTENPVTCKVQDLGPLMTNRFLRLKVTKP